MSEQNIFTIYDKFVDKMVQKCFEGGSEAKKDSSKFSRSSPNITEVHQKFALEIIFGGSWEVRKIVKKLFSKSVPLEQALRAGILMKYSDQTTFLSPTDRLLNFSWLNSFSISSLKAAAAQTWKWFWNFLLKFCSVKRKTQN